MWKQEGDVCAGQCLCGDVQEELGRMCADIHGPELKSGWADRFRYMPEQK
jgi:hypothetical protein